MQTVRQLHPIRKILAWKAQLGRRVTETKRPVLFFGVHPGVPETVLPQTDPWYLAAREVVERCRAFPHDLAVFREYEPEIEYLDCLTESGKDSLDIGANIGFYSAFLSPRSRFVYAFEANRRILPFLQTALSACANCLVIPLAVGKAPSMEAFHIPDMHPDPIQFSGSGGLLKRLMDSLGIPTKPMQVPIVAIDGFGFDSIGCMKIDVEGSEIDVLTGAEQTIARCRPSVIVENEYRHNP